MEEKIILLEAFLKLLKTIDFQEYCVVQGFELDLDNSLSIIAEIMLNYKQ